MVDFSHNLHCLFLNLTKQFKCKNLHFKYNGHPLDTNVSLLDESSLFKFSSTFACFKRGLSCFLFYLNWLSILMRHEQICKLILAVLGTTGNRPTLLCRWKDFLIPIPNSHENIWPYLLSTVNIIAINVFTMSSAKPISQQTKATPTGIY